MVQFFDKYLKIGSSPSDCESKRLKKSSLILITLINATAAFFWGLIYIYLNHYLSASIPLFYTFISAFNLWHLHKTRNIIPLQKTQIVLVLILPFLLMWSLGGFALGSFVMIWAFFAPIAALTYERNSKSLYWFFAFLALVLLSTIIDQSLIENQTKPLSQTAIEVFFLLNISAGLSGIYFLIKYYIDAKEISANKRLQKEHDALLESTQKLKKVNYKLKHIAAHDTLTGLPNRYHLQENIIKMIASSKRSHTKMALLFIDLDGFKKVNDNFGHAMGDIVLKIVGQRIKALLREEDAIARIGGDEFAIAMANITNIAYVENIALRMIEEISRDYSCISSLSTPIGASIGISLYPHDSNNMEMLFQKADAAMYHAKEKGKGAFQFFNEALSQAPIS